jgi:hypothetical protein
MNINDISSIAEYGRKLQMPIFTEVIMGLPGETLETWKQNLENILNANLHNGIDTFFLNMIENAPMMGDIKQYDIKTFSANDMFYETSDSLDAVDRINESIEVVKSTNTLSAAELEEVLIYTWYLIGFHVYGISDIISIYLKNSKNVSYTDFYSELIEYLSGDKQIKEWEAKIRAGYSKWHETGILQVDINRTDGHNSDEFLRLTSWQISNSLSLIMHYNNSVDYYVRLVKEFVTSKYDVDPDIVDDYELMTSNRIKQWGKYMDNPKQICTKTTLYDYSQNSCADVVKKQQYYTITDRYDQYPKELLHHIDSIIFGRRRAWVLNMVDKL